MSQFVSERPKHLAIAVALFIALAIIAVKLFQITLN